MDTSWNKVANWYDSHLKGGKKTYHQTLVLPGVLNLIKKYVKRGSLVVDLACGQGQITAGIAHAGFVTKGVDISPNLIEIAKTDYRGSGIEFFVDDVSNLDTVTLKKLGMADAVVTILAIQNIASLDGVFSSISTLLKPTGKAIIVMNHPYFRVPKITSWGFDGNTSQYRRVDGYMSAQKFTIEMNPGLVAKKGKSNPTWSFHRPLQEYIKSMNSQGLVLLDMEEWISNRISEPGARAKSENKARKEIPLFMALVVGHQQVL